MQGILRKRLFKFGAYRELNLDIYSGFGVGNNRFTRKVYLREQTHPRGFRDREYYSPPLTELRKGPYGYAILGINLSFTWF